MRRTWAAEVDVTEFRELFDQLMKNVESVIRGSSEPVRLALTCLLAEGHLLIEDLPGVAKTSMAKAIATSMVGGSFKRIQFTPDLLPSDVTGGQVYNLKDQSFEFVRGPVFSHVLLADEINRASPKTQSALLQAMAEGEVTAGRDTFALEPPFLCIATQNPIEHHGTYPLPEAQLDRFMMRISMGGHPQKMDEKAILAWAMDGGQAARLQPVLAVSDIVDMTKVARSVHVGDALQSYLVEVIDRTRRDADVRVGVSPRGTIALAVAAQTRAASLGRSFASADDVKALAVPVLAHRLVLGADARVGRKSAASVVQAIIDSVAVPRRP